MKFLCNRRSDNRGAMIAIYCSMPWLFYSNSTSKAGSHSMFATVLSVCLVLAAGLAAFFVCRKRGTEA